MTDCLIAFDSTQQAIRTEMLLEYAEIEIDTMPTPKEITAGCSLTVAFNKEDLPKVVRILRQEKVEIRGIYLKTPGGYESIEWQVEMS